MFRKIDYQQAAFLYSHGWNSHEIAEKLGCHPNTVLRAIRVMGLSTNYEVEPRPAVIEEAIRATKKRIEFFLNHRNPCEFTWEENLVELLWGMKRLVSRKRALVKN